MMEYKGYIGVVEYDDEANILHGEVINTRDVITFQAKSVDEIQTAFKESVDDYLAFCAETGEEPDKPFSGKLMLRMPPDLHRQVVTAAKASGKSINGWITDHLVQSVREELGTYRVKEPSE